MPPVSLLLIRQEHGRTIPLPEVRSDRLQDETQIQSRALPVRGLFRTMAEERAQRRLAAILAADVVGYGRLLERDEAGTLAALKARRRDILNPLVAEHHGRIVKVMGDGVLIEFGSAVNAVACAIELQTRMTVANDGLAEGRWIELRIGINLG